MDTHTHTRHRHFVALPMAVLFLAVSLLPYSPRSGTALRAEVELKDGIGGTGIIAGQGIFSVQVSGWKLVGMNGGFHVVLSGDRLTVSALTTPVFLERGEERMLVPVGTHWTTNLSEELPSLDDGASAWAMARVPEFLPERFVLRKFDELGDARVEDVLPNAAELESVPAGDYHNVFLLPAAEQARSVRRGEAVLGMLRSAVESGSDERVREVLGDPDSEDVFASERGTVVLSALLSQATDAQQMDLLQPLLARNDIWMLASLHPDTRSVAWALDAEDHARDTELLRLLVLPFSDFRAEPVSDFAFTRFAIAIRREADADQNPGELLRALFAAHASLPERAEAQGYPHRAGRLAELLVSLLRDDVQELNVRERATLGILATRGRERLEPERGENATEETEESSASAETPVGNIATKEEGVQPGFPPEEVEARAYRMLSQAHALFAVNTGIAAISGTEARITDVLFASSGGDRSATFTLDVLSGIVSAIALDGEAGFPYETPFPAFVEWVRR